MMNTRIKKLLLHNFFKPQHRSSESGMTILELLVGAIMAFLIITPMLSFLVNILDDDRREGARTIADEEVQAALEFITADLSQAFYIYDATGLTAINAQIQRNNRTPILAFWKRELVERVKPPRNNVNCSTPAGSAECDDAFVSALVVYYYTEERNDIWSNQGRIERMMIRDGFVNENNQPLSNINGPQGPDPAYAPFNPNDWNAWTRGTGNLPNSVVLMDYVDRSTTFYNNNTQPTNDTCKEVLGYVAPTPPTPPTDPPQLINNASFSFYTCVDSARNIAKVTIRGHALARMQDNSDYEQARQSFFPVRSTVIRGLGRFTTRQ